MNFERKKNLVLKQEVYCENRCVTGIQQIKMWKISFAFMYTYRTNIYTWLHISWVHTSWGGRKKPDIEREKRNKFGKFDRARKKNESTFHVSGQEFFPGLPHFIFQPWFSLSLDSLPPISSPTSYKKSLSTTFNLCPRLLKPFPKFLISSF